MALNGLGTGLGDGCGVVTTARDPLGGHGEVIMHAAVKPRVQV
jgi:hypothetical protein